MRYLLLVAVLAVGCGENPLRPTPSVPPPPAAPTCAALIPGEPGHWVYIEGRGWWWYAGRPALPVVVPCD
jgi:hypothetical protein